MSKPTFHVSRRAVLGSGCAVCASLAFPRKGEAVQNYFDGCFITPPGYEKFRIQNDGVYSVSDGLMAKSRHFRTTGDANVDRDLDRAIGIVADLFKVTPAFGFYNPDDYKGTGEAESWRMNAWATTEDTDIAGTRGTIGFGWDLFRTEFFDYDRSGSTIIAIVAHEFGHILQGQRGFLSRLRTGAPRKSEINADFLAGYYLGTRKRANPSLSFKKAGELFIRLGRMEDGDDNRTHGNSKERIDAAERGFRIAYVDNKDLDHALEAGLEYVGAK